jgi:signal transduction histidine kinase
MNKLRTRFAMALGIVLFVATILPMLILYLLSTSGLVEATYVSETNNSGQDSRTLVNLPISIPPTTTYPSPLTWAEGIENERRFPLSRIDPETGQLIPPVSFDPERNQWISRIPSDLQRVVLTSPAFQFRVDMPAWIALGSLPLIGLLLGLILSVILSRSVTRPVSQLAQAVQAIGRRELSYRVESRGSQELQELAQSFNRMAEELDQSEITRRNLMADTAHELRTPLAVLEGNLRAMLDGVHALNEEEISLLYEQTHHLNRLVDDLRELSLAEANQLLLNFQGVDLTRLVKETVAHFDLSAQEQGIHLTAELDEPLIHPGLDENRMRQVLHNLLSNAFRHTPRGGRVTISAKHSADESGLEISIADTGAGLSPEELPYIFKRFYRVEGVSDTDQGRTGLGLAIVKAIVEAQGGCVSAQSAGRHQGSTFTIRLPLGT